MTLGGTANFAGPPAVLWDLLHNPIVLAKVLPGVKTLTRVGDDRFEGTMKVSVGPVTAAEFTVAATLKDETPPSHFVMEIDGKGGLGFVRGSSIVDLQDAPDGGTILTYSSDLLVGGRIAAVGQRLMESVARKMTQQALDALTAELKKRLETQS